MNAITNHMPTAELQALDAAHHMHPFTANGELAEKGARIITRASGVTLTDSEGNEILDARLAGGITDPAAMEQRLQALPGVVECGLFVGLCHVLVIGPPDGRTEVRERPA